MMTLLIIDGNIPFSQALAEIIANQWPLTSIEKASNNTTGLEKTKQIRPHLVFVDIHLGGIKGPDLVRKIKGINPETVIVGFTSYDLPEYHRAMQESGVDHFISKDAWTGKELVALVESIVSGLRIESRGQPEG